MSGGRSAELTCWNLAPTVDLRLTIWPLSSPPTGMEICKQKAPFPVGKSPDHTCLWGNIYSWGGLKCHTWTQISRSAGQIAALYFIKALWSAPQEVKNKTSALPTSRDFFRIFSGSTTDKTWLIILAWLSVAPMSRNVGSSFCRFSSVRHKLRHVYLYLKIFLVCSLNFWILYHCSKEKGLIQKELYCYWA